MGIELLDHLFRHRAISSRILSRTVNLQLARLTQDLHHIRYRNYLHILLQYPMNRVDMNIL